MQSISKDELKEILEDIFEARAKMDSEEHADQHEWLKTRIKAENDREEFYREAIKTVIQWSIAGMLASIVYFVQGHFK
jgi:galactose-1-phosphate uridylyltransferase